MTVTVEVFELVFEAPPDVAEPPVVLPLTLAVPLVELWLLVLAVAILLVTTAFSVRLLLTLAWLFELGPVVETVILSVGGANGVTVVLLLLTVTLAWLVLPLVAVPEPAEPPVVLPLTLVAPLVAPWLLLLVELTELLVGVVTEALLLTDAWLFELVPVPVIVTVEAAATPTPRPTVAMAIAP